MPRKKTIKKKKERELQQAAIGKQLTFFMDQDSLKQEEERQFGSASKDQENVIETGSTAGELQSEAREESQHRRAANKEDVIAKLKVFHCPTDAAHMQTFNINLSDRYIEMYEKVGPCQQPVMTFPKNAEGRSFLSRWYTDRPWLEYSPKNYAIYCFSCHIFLREENSRTKQPGRH